MTDRYCEPCEYRGKMAPATTSYMSPVAGLTLCCAECKRTEAPVASALELGAKSIAVHVPSQSKSATSGAGARKASLKAGSQAYQCLVAISKAPDGLTREQVIEITGLKESAACGRLNSLGKGKDGTGLHYIFVSGLRESSAGVLCDIYHITQAGREYLAAANIGRAAA